MHRFTNPFAKLFGNLRSNPRRRQPKAAAGLGAVPEVDFVLRQQISRQFIRHRHILAGVKHGGVAAAPRPGLQRLAGIQQDHAVPLVAGHQHPLRVAVIGVEGHIPAGGRPGRPANVIGGIIGPCPGAQPSHLVEVVGQRDLHAQLPQFGVAGMPLHGPVNINLRVPRHQ